MSRPVKPDKKSLARVIGALICIIGTAIIAVNMINMYGYLRQQARQQGEARLQTVSNSMQRTLDKSKSTLLRFAADVEVFIATGTDIDEMKYYLKSQSNIFRDQSEGTLINAYICTEDWVIISDSPIPEGYSVSDRGWYGETVKSGIGNIHISAPYEDAFTGQMCFTASLLLSDGKTLVCLDYDLSLIQESVLQMNREVNGEALIISRDGLLVGCTDGEHSGRRLEEALPQYVSIYNRLLYEDRDSLFFDAPVGGKKYTVFCNRSGEWFFVYALDADALYADTHRIMALNFIPRTAVLLAFIAYYLYVRKRLENTHLGENEQTADNSGEISAAKINADAGHMTGFTKSSRNGIMSIMILTITVAVAFTGIVLVKWGSDRIEREVDSYNYQLERWTNTQLQTLNMFVDTIAANPSVLDDYDYAVDYLDRIVSNYPEISAAYIARPGNEHEMTMNNGWVPNADYVVAERQWYVDTENSENKMSVSSPYLDARTGLYCVTFSRVVYNSFTGEQIGVFALDFYIGNLTGIMEASYADDGYAFLVDNSNIIVNHPNPEYQTSADRSVNLSGTEYSELKNSPSIKIIRDYDGGIKACISRTEAVTGFSVIAVKDVMTVYGVVLLSGGVFITLLAVCIVLLYKLIVRMMDWQEKTRLALIAEADRASRADHAKSSFLAQMSHEIRTPINAVLGMNEMILRESKEENILGYASNAYNSGNALLSIINDILDISKIEAGKLEIAEAEYDLYSLVSDCRNMTLNRAEKKGLAFSVKCDKELPSRLEGDMIHIRQTVVNFLTNAIKYTDKGNVELDISGRNEGGRFMLRFEIKDTGIGIKPENLEKLFTSFQRFDLEHNQTIEGSGLGLSICKQLTELMGGSVSAQSVYGQGSTFICEIPQKVVNAEPIGELHFERSADKVKMEKQDMFVAPDARLLVVDDVEMNLFVFTSFLKENRMQIDTALSGRKCLELCAENKYDIIFMDHMMPEMDGLETFDRLKSERLITEDTPVIMLTANAISGEEEKYLAAGFAAYLTKPVQSGKLEGLLLKFLPKEKVTFRERTVQETQPAPAPQGSELFDEATGMMYNGGSRDIYHTVLKMYVVNGRKKRDEIAALFAEERWKDYTTEVHALKSTSLMIGSKQLSEAAKELELASKAGNTELIREKNDSLLKLYEKVISLGEELLRRDGVITDVPDKEQDSGELTEISAEKLNELIERIKTSCGDYDADEAERLCAEGAGYRCGDTALKPMFEKVRAAAADFEYDAAADRAQEIADLIRAQ